MKIEPFLKSTLVVLHQFIVQDEQKHASTIKDLEKLFFDTIQEACNVRGPEDIENFIDGFDDEFHMYFSRVGKKLNWSFNGI